MICIILFVSVRFFPYLSSFDLSHRFDAQDDGSHKLQDCGNKVYATGRLNFVAAFL